MKLKDFGFKSNKYVNGITCDSRQVKKGYIFDFQILIYVIL